ncbi:LPS-assembly lipoprotein LptE [Balneatrix alpica]|uniref:LPS-assembly lipoprotein LptE n=1 Tax=Balneatrix alpica TaxID=75684 RepID=A0ABV5ZG50_9GAMM|nr:hypothetical protein [Balneatrix alpica]
MRILVWALALVLAGCGFQLRGYQSGGEGGLPIATSDSALQDRLTAVLSQMGINTEQGSGDYVQVLLLDERQDRSLIDSRGNATENLLVTRISYRMVRPGAEFPEVPKHLQVERTYRVDENAQLASDTQAGQIREEMLRELLIQLQARFEAFKRQ